jgi:ribulose kinase
MYAVGLDFGTLSVRGRRVETARGDIGATGDTTTPGELA